MTPFKMETPLSSRVIPSGQLSIKLAKCRVDSYHHPVGCESFHGKRIFEK
jgi:hypothetical protein